MIDIFLVGLLGMIAFYLGYVLAYGFFGLVGLLGVSCGHLVSRKMSKKLFYWLMWALLIVIFAGGLLAALAMRGII